MQASNIPEKIDAVVLAGTHLEKDKLIFGHNKAFLEFHGKPVVQWVIEALGQARRIDRIVVVGPIERVRSVQDKTSVPFIAVEQKGQLISNSWVAFLALCPQAEAFPTDFLEFQAAKEEGTFIYPAGLDIETPYLFISGDVPLAVPEAIDDFVERCQQREYDMYYGVTGESDLKPYYPTCVRKGIKRPYVNFREGRVRVANIQIVRPLKFGRLHLIQGGYSVRKLKMWRNLFRMVKLIARLPYGVRGAGFATLLQLSSLMYKYGLQKWVGPVVRRSSMSTFEWYISQYLQSRFTLVVSPYAGLSLDIDESDDYHILLTFFREWLEHERTIAKLLPELALNTDSQKE
ncbi:nucleotidyltransferase family protein [bacterium]|nr:nucleotidyltransferase family protein [bacterium]